MGSTEKTDQPQKPKPINKQLPPIKNGQRVLLRKGDNPHNQQLVRPQGIPRPLVVHGGLPVGNYVVVRVPVIYAPQALYYVQQSPLSPHVYVSPSHYYTPVAVSQLPQVFAPQPRVNPPAAAALPPLVVPQPVLVNNNKQPPAASTMVIKNNIQTPPASLLVPIYNGKHEISKMDISTDNSNESELETYNDSSYTDCSSEDDEKENTPEVPVNDQNSPKVEIFELLQQQQQQHIAQVNEDLAFSIQLENILNLEDIRIPAIKPPAPVISNSQEALTMDEIIHLYKSGEPVDDHINFYIALNPEKALDFEKLLETEVSSQSILHNVQQFYKERDPYPTIDDDFIIDYFTPSDDEVQENWTYED